jgi:hypothetical protein
MKNSREDKSLDGTLNNFYDSKAESTPCEPDTTNMYSQLAALPYPLQTLYASGHE